MKKHADIPGWFNDDERQAYRMLVDTIPDNGIFVEDIIAGHDFSANWPGVKQAVQESFDLSQLIISERVGG